VSPAPGAPGATPTSLAVHVGPAAAYPDPRRTPGARSSQVNDGNVQQTICVPGYTATVRDVPTALKMLIRASYGVQSEPPGNYEIDHFIPLEVGGSNDPENLWPQPYAGDYNAHDKDGLENRLHERVCAGNISLSVAQRLIVSDWVAAWIAEGRPR
jgi:hypothetical protein